MIIGLITLAVILGLGWVAKHYYDAYHEADGKVTELESTNKNLVFQVNLLRESKQLDNDVIADQRQTIANLTALNGEHKAQVSAEVKKILDKYGKLPPTPENLDKQALEVSTVRIMGLWKTFCVTRPNYPICEQFKQEQPGK